MTSTNKFLSTVAALSLTAVATPALAVTCAEFSEMSAQEQSEILSVSPAFGAMYDDSHDKTVSEGTSEAEGADEDAVSVVDKDASTGGREAQREMGRGADLILRVMEDCKINPESELEDVISRSQ